MLAGQPDGEPLPILFPTRLLHREIAMCHDTDGLVVVSAGSCDISKEPVEAWGYSESLQMSSREVDASIIGAFFG